MTLASCEGADKRVITVRHGPASPPTFIDVGDEGASPGDQRIFHIDARSGSTPVTLNFVMITTALDAPANGVENPISTAVFRFGDGPDDTILLQGEGWYPGQGSTVAVSATVTRAVVGGTGKCAGASGWVASTRNADDTWSQTFHLR